VLSVIMGDFIFPLKLIFESKSKLNPTTWFYTKAQINFGHNPSLKLSYKPSLKPKIMSDRPTINYVIY